MKPRILLTIAWLISVAAMPVWAQHGHDHATAADTAMVEAETEMPTFLPGAPENRIGSGTSWLPDNSPMTGLHKMSGAWQIMGHGNLFVGYTRQNIGRQEYRHGDQFNSRNWIMVMAQRPLSAQSMFMARTMLSADRLTAGGNGYPLLLQSGESWQGQPIIDRQHPHDVFSELAAVVSYRLTDGAALIGYIGYPGEPAFGPSVFMHRPSAVNLPDAPLGHHWQDATHITFGVATAGIAWRRVLLDGSLFTGREPDENRYDFDRARFDSYSARLSMVPADPLALQLSWAFLKSPEALEPDVDQRKTAASILVNPHVSSALTVTTALIWSMNDPSTEEPSHSVLGEVNADIGKTALFGRAEWVEKSSHDLGLEGQFGERTFNTYGLTVGLAREIITWQWVGLRVGGQVSLNQIGSELQQFYGSNPVSYQLFLRMSPPSMTTMRHEGNH